ncbi:hypothetical protein M2305_000215 [Gluconobacter cerinus]|nr:hypothetical protein [Gluconobacter cerinus]
MDHRNGLSCWGFIVAAGAAARVTASRTNEIRPARW